MARRRNTRIGRKKAARMGVLYDPLHSPKKKSDKNGHKVNEENEENKKNKIKTR